MSAQFLMTPAFSVTRPMTGSPRVDSPLWVSGATALTVVPCVGALLYIPMPGTSSGVCQSRDFFIPR